MPFRQLSISQDSKVIICCNDFGHEYICGDAFNDSLKAIWEGDEFEAVRRVLKHSNRGFSPCSNCNIGAGARCYTLPKYPKMEKKHASVIWHTTNKSERKNSFEPFISEDIQSIASED